MAEPAYDDRPHIIPDFSYDGCLVRWVHVGEKDREPFRETITAYADHFKDRYRVELHFGAEEFRMNLAYRKPSTAIARQLQKGEVFAMVGDTVWGGGSG